MLRGWLKGQKHYIIDSRGAILHLCFQKMPNQLTQYEQEVLSALYKVSGYLAEQHEPEQGQDRSKEIDTVNLIIERVEAKN